MKPARRPPRNGFALAGAAALLSCLGCASRGPRIETRIPEFAPAFEASRYSVVDGENDRVYYSKELLARWTPPAGFDEKDFERRDRPDGTVVYVPRRYPGDSSETSARARWVPSSARPGEKSLLIAPPGKD